jgi:hypothetical protein
MATIGFYTDPVTGEIYKSLDKKKKELIKKTLMELIKGGDIKAISAPIAAPKPAEPVATSPTLQNSTASISNYRAPKAPPVSPGPAAPPAIRSSHAQSATPPITPPKAPPVTMRINKEDEARKKREAEELIIPDESYDSDEPYAPYRPPPRPKRPRVPSLPPRKKPSSTALKTADSDEADIYRMQNMLFLGLGLTIALSPVVVLLYQMNVEKAKQKFSGLVDFLKE